MLDRFLKYFIKTPAPCPYDLPYQAVYRQGLLGPVPPPLMQALLTAGFRRNGNSLYTMACPACQACVPIRLRPATFRPNRNQKRIFRKNSDITAEVGPLTITAEKLALLNKFLTCRYPRHGSSAAEYYSGFFLNTITATFEIAYRLKGRLLGLSVVDVNSAWLNSVYFFFDPAEGQRSPGTYNILYLVEFAKRYQIDLLYLGYWIKEVAAMRYKANFKPHELLADGAWRAIGKG